MCNLASYEACKPWPTLVVRISRCLEGQPFTNPNMVYPKQHYQRSFIKSYKETSFRHLKVQDIAFSVDLQRVTKQLCRVLKSGQVALHVCICRLEILQ